MHTNLGSRLADAEEVIPLARPELSKRVAKSADASAICVCGRHTNRKVEAYEHLGRVDRNTEALTRGSMLSNPLCCINSISAIRLQASNARDSLLWIGAPIGVDNQVRKHAILYRIGRQPTGREKE